MTQWKRLCDGTVYGYDICEDGRVMKTSLKRFKTSLVTPYIKNGMATVKVNRKEYTLKNLVARNFIKGYRPGDYVEVLDGNPLHCAAGNLRIYTKAEHGRKTGHMSRSQTVIADGVEYRSIRECAKALHASYQTVLDYMAGRVGQSVLTGRKIERKEPGV